MFRLLNDIVNDLQLPFNVTKSTKHRSFLIVNRGVAFMLML